MKSIVYVQLPKAGLGNKLIVWARAYVFTQRYSFKFYRNSWFYFNLGPWIRQEKKKRTYFYYFTSWSFKSCILTFIIPFIPKKFIIWNPETVEISKKFKIYFFNWNNSFYDFFLQNIHSKKNIYEGLLFELTKKIREKILALESPEIGVHIRRGDWKYSAWWIDNDYYIKRIKEIRLKTGNENLPVTIFSDGRIDEIKEILLLNNVSLAKNNEDILDIFQLSQSKYIILSRGSSFGYWAAFFSEAMVILHPEDEINQNLSSLDNKSKEFFVKWNKIV
jgi:hypothetical protein